MYIFLPCFRAATLGFDAVTVKLSPHDVNDVTLCLVTGAPGDEMSRKG